MLLFSVSSLIISDLQTWQFGQFRSVTLNKVIIVLKINLIECCQNNLSVNVSEFGNNFILLQPI